MKNISGKYWYMIPMPDTVIDRVNLLGKDQPEILVFTDRKGQIIGDNDVYLTGVDGDENQAPLQIENENDIEYKQDQEEQEDANP